MAEEHLNQPGVLWLPPSGLLDEQRELDKMHWPAEDIDGPKNAPYAPWDRDPGGVARAHLDGPAVLFQPPSWLNQMRRGDFYADYQEAE